MTDNDGSEPGYYKQFGIIMLWSLLLTGALISSVFVIANLDAFSDGGTSLDWMQIASGAIGTAVFGYFTWRYFPDFTMGEPNTERGNRIRWLLVGIVVFGIAASIPFNLGKGPSGERLDLLSNGAIPLSVAIPIMVIWGIGVPLLGLFGRHNADEHAKAAGDFGMMIGFQTFSIAAPIWWIGWRGGLLPRPDVMLLFVAVLVVCTIANTWKRAN